MLRARRKIQHRKVLGAELRNIAANIGNEYLILFAAALIIGHRSDILTKLMIEATYAYRIPIALSGVTVIVILTLILMISASTQVAKVLKANPVKGLTVQ